MIKVEFRIEPGDDEYTLLRQWSGIMPWLQYLVENFTDMRIREIYDPASYQSVVTFEFELEPKKETYYRLKYGDGTQTAYQIQ